VNGGPRSVWYVAYGSNLSWPRFRCYLVGGQPAGGTRVYQGSRDASSPPRREPVRLPGGLVFAGSSSVWGGGIAFYDDQAVGRVACRAYLVSVEQFADVAAQEMRLPPGGAVARELAEQLIEVGSAHVAGTGRYDTIPRLGELDGIPLLTVTHSAVRSMVPACPSSPYVTWIVRGLHESHGWEPGRAGEYLTSFPGMAGRWTAREVAELG
jgi:hypothetical protein